MGITPEQAAREFGPALCLAQKMHRMGAEPRPGELFEVDVLVHNLALSGTEAGLVADHFVFETPVTGRLTEAALRVVREHDAHLHTGGGLAGWTRIVEKLLISTNDPNEEIEETEDYLERLILDYEAFENQLRADARETWALAYLKENWLPHIPDAESRDYYRGEADALGLAQACLEKKRPSMQPAVMRLLNGVHLFLANVAAKRYFGRPVGPSASDVDGIDLSRAVAEHRVDSFRIDLRDATAIASSLNEESFRILETLDPEWSEPLSDTDFAPQEETDDFYRGNVHGFELSLRAVRLFAAFPIFAASAAIPSNLPLELERMSQLTAQTWIAKAQPA